MDDRLHDLGRAARAEAEASIDVDRAWASFNDELAAGTPTTTIGDRDAGDGRSPWPWLAVAATLVAVVAGLVLLRNDDAAIQITDVPATRVPVGTVPASTVPASTPSAPGTIGDSTPQPSTTVPSTTVAPSTVAPTTLAPTPSTLIGTAIPTVEWRDLEWEGSPIARVCVQEFECTQLRMAPDGTTVSYDPSGRVLTRHTTPPVTAAVPETYGRVWIELVGPDNVVYLNVDPTVPDGDGVAADLVAVSLAPGDAGREIDRWPDVTDRIGDSDLVATRDGIVRVGCCGPDTVRPAADAPIEAPWVARNGGVTIVADRPEISVVLEYPRTTFRRDELSWTVESEDGGRGMPTVVPTFDGGIIALLAGQDGHTTVVRGWADGSVEQVRLATLDGQVAAVEPTGIAVIENGDRFARVRPFADHAERWTGRLDLDLSDWSVSATDLNDLLDAESPRWESDPVAFAEAVSAPLAVNETRSVRVLSDDRTSLVVEVITANFFDDSVSAGRHTLTLERQPDDSLRFVSGRYANTCQQGRGPQEFTSELCV